VGIILTGVVATRIALEERLLRERYPDTDLRSIDEAVVPYLL
jgi:hypothetical protein